MTLVDSSVWIHYFAPKVPSTPAIACLERLLGREAVLIGDLILVEVLQGLRSDLDFRRVQDALAELPVVEVGGETLALQAARNYRFLRQRGVTIRSTIDTMIATRCIEEDIPLLHADRDFLPFEEHLGLRSAI